MSAIRQRHFSALAALSVLTIAAMATSAQAQKKSAGADPGPVFEGMLQCRTITEDSARLACFDRQVAAFADAQKTGEVIVAERKVVEQARESAFGLAVGESTLLRGPDGQPLKSLSSEIIDVRKLPGSGRWVMSLENGSRWEQMDPPTIRFVPEKKQTLQIERGALGSYIAKLNGKGSFAKVKRIQ